MADDRKDDIAFAKEALASLGAGRVLLPALLLALFQSASCVAALATLPIAEHPDHSRSVAALLLLLLGLTACSVALLRILNFSPRPPWQPDASLWLFGLAIIASLFIGIAADLVVGGRDDLLAGLASGALSVIVNAPFAPWFTAIAVERPLALRPGDHMRHFAAWLPALLLWNLLIVVPLGQLFALLGRTLLAGAGGWFWPTVLLYGLLGAAIELVSCALASVAYRRVARS
ncbi:MAG TPA: hypothetical protein VFW19_11840 [Allosphingosinicella sp.]|nr:hypothetical protein [Allosphingosinicella sp.]